jgi:hypothetical protein
VNFKRKQVEDKMGLDQWCYVKNNESQHELIYYRKHPNLHGWMKQLWVNKGMPGIDDMNTDFNGIELELTWEDVDNLERAVRHGMLPSTQGFFFGNSADEVYFEQDLEFCVNAKAELFLGLKVFYNSSW